MRASWSIGLIARVTAVSRRRKRRQHARVCLHSNRACTGVAGKQNPVLPEQRSGVAFPSEVARNRSSKYCRLIEANATPRNLPSFPIIGRAMITTQTPLEYGVPGC